MASRSTHEVTHKRRRRVEYPMQPVVYDRQRVIRFKENKIVRFLLNAGPFDMNKLAAMNFSVEDREQFLQLIGYSVSGFGELSYVRKTTVERADHAANRLAKQQWRK